MSLAGVIRRLGTQVTVTRTVAGTYVKGVHQPGESSSFGITASVQPASGRDLLRLEEGQRTRETITVFTPDDLRTTDEATGTPADRIEWQGSTYEVQVVENWTPGRFRKALAQRVEAR